MKRSNAINTCFIISLAIIAVMIFLLPSTKPKVQEDAPEENFTYDSDLVMITAAHFTHTNFDGYKLVWKDEETDRAVYIKDDYTPKQVVSVGDTVVFDGDECEVTEVHEQGFVINIGRHPEHGMSGTPIYYKDADIAFVSQAVSTKEIYCVYK